MKPVIPVAAVSSRRLRVLSRALSFALVLSLRVAAQTVETGPIAYPAGTTRVPSTGYPSTLSTSGAISVVNGAAVSYVASSQIKLEPGFSVTGGGTFHAQISAMPLPQGLTASNVAFQSLTLQWTAASSDIGATGYEVRRDTTSLGIVTVPSMNIAGLQPGGSYAFSVRVRDGSNTWSDWSAPLTVATPADSIAPSVPAALSSSSVTGASFTVSWSPAQDATTIVAYEIRRDGVTIGSTATTSFSLTGLSPNTRYAVQVRAQDSGGNWSDWSDPYTVVTPAGVLTFQSQSDTTDPDTGSHWLTTTYVNLANANLIVHYSYDETYTDSTYGTDDHHPDDTQVLAPNQTFNEFDWTNEYPVEGYTEHRVQSITRVETANIPVITCAPTQVSAVGVPTAYILTANNSPTSFTATGLPPGVNVDAAGNITGTPTTAGTFSVAVSATNSYGTGYGTVVWTVIVDTEPPAAPLNIHVSDLTAPNFTLTWSPATDNVGVVAYEVQVDGSPVATLPGCTTTINFNSADAVASVAVRAKDGSGNWSSTGSAIAFRTYAVSVDHGTVNSPIAIPGSIHEITADLPPVGNYFSGWTITGPGTIDKPQMPTAIFTAGDGDSTIKANYAPGYRLDGRGGMTMSSAGGVAGQTITLHADAALPGYVFNGWDIVGPGMIVDANSPDTQIVLGPGSAMIWPRLWPATIPTIQTSMGAPDYGDVNTPFPVSATAFSSDTFEWQSIDYSLDGGLTWTYGDAAHGTLWNGVPTWFGNPPVFAWNQVLAHITIDRAATVLFRTWAVNTVAASAAAFDKTIVSQPGALPWTPLNLRAENVSDAGFTLRWDPAAGTPSNLSYEVYLDGGPYHGIMGSNGSNAFANIGALSPGVPYTFKVRVRSWTETSPWSVPVSLSVGVPPSITGQPAGQVLEVGQPLSLAVTAIGSGPLNYQWTKDGNAIAGATGDTYTVSGVQLSDAGTYQCSISNALGTIVSDLATVVVTGLPRITAQPDNQFVAPGGNATFDIAASSSLPLTYQWRKDGADIAGANSTTLALSNVQAGDAGSYAVVVSNSAGAVTSASATLTVTSQDPSVIDTDGDGLTDLAETYLGRNPKVAELSIAPTSPADVWPTGPADVVGRTDGSAGVSPNGASVYSIPISVSPGTAGMQPSLALVYSSQNAEGVAGIGWQVSGVPSITRGPATMAVDGFVHGVDFTSNDRFYLNGARLIAVSTDKAYGADGAEYRTEIDTFAKIVSYGSAGSGPLYFKVWTKSGQVIEFGNTADSRLTPGDHDGIHRDEVMIWGANRISDRSDNAVKIAYQNDSSGGEILVDSLKYTCNTAAPDGYAGVSFVYEDRPDARSGFLFDALVSRTKRLKTIKCTYTPSTASDPEVFHRYELDYYPADATTPSRLESIQEFGANGESLPATTLEYSAEAGGGIIPGTEYEVPKTQIQFTSDEVAISHPANFRAADLDGDGVLDVIQATDSGITMLRNINGAYKAVASLPLSASGGSVTSAYDPWLQQRYSPGTLVAADIDGDGKAEILALNYPAAGKVTAIRWDGTGLAKTEMSVSGSVAGLALVGTFAADLNHDGRDDLIILEANNTYDKWGVTVYISNGNSFTGAFRSTGLAYTSSDQFFAVDTDGDGTPELLRVYKNGTVDSVDTLHWNGTGFVAAGTLNLRPHVDQSHYLAIDVNGDGMSDLVRLARPSGANAADIWLHRGTTFFFSKTQSGGSWSGDIRVVPFDYNGDGRADVGVFYKTPGGSGTSLEIWTSAGDGFSPTQAGQVSSQWSYQAPDFGEFKDFAAVGGRLDGASTGGLLLLQSTTVDYNYRFVIDFGTIRPLFVKNRTPNLLKSITDGFGAKAEFTYLPLTAESIYEKGSGATYPDADIRIPINVVSQLIQGDGNGGTYALQYTYGGLRANVWRGLQGFEWVDRLDGRTGLDVKTTYFQEFPFTGMVKNSQTTAGAVVIGSTDNTPQVKTTAVTFGTETRTRYFPYVGTSVTKSADLTGSAIATVVTTATYDDYGNEKTLLQESYDGQPADLTTTVPYETSTLNTYDNLTTDWLIGLPRRQETTAKSPDYPDDSITRTTSWEYYPNTPRLKAMTVEPDSAQTALTTSYEYDDFGNLKKATVSGGDIATRTSETDYDATDDQPYAGRFPSKSYNALNESTTYHHDGRFGVMLKQTDDGNSLSTQWVPDGFGRIVEEDRPDTTKTIKTYRWDNTAVTYTDGSSSGVYHVDVSRTGAPPSLALYNALGRTIRTQTMNADGAITQVDTQYDDRGNAVSVSRPYYSTQSDVSRIWSTTSYDKLNRPLTITTPREIHDGSMVYATTSIDYDGLSVTETNPRLYATKTTKNCLGWTMDVVKNSNAAASALDRSEVTFKHDGFGNIKATTDSAAHTIKNDYDNRGHKITMVDPDMGTWSYTYYVDGTLHTQTDGNGKLTTYTYDKLGRADTKTEGARTTGWTYVPSGTKGNGQPQDVTVTEPGQQVYKESWTYDDFARPETTTRRILGSDYAFTQRYDEQGRPSVTIYPGGFATRNVYNTFGYLAEVRECDPNGTYLGKIDWAAAGSDAAGNLETSYLGNGAVVDHTYYPNGRLSGIVSKLYHIPRVQAYSYALKPLVAATEAFAYDANGNLSSRSRQGWTTAGSLTSTEIFTYDGLDRLGHVTLNGADTKDYNYDQIGNLTSKTGLGSYTYDPDHPHAVHTVAGGTYTYDAMGNMLTGPNLAIEWNQFNQPKTITRSGHYSNFTYGAQEERVVQATDEGTTTYVGSLYERYQPASGTLVERYYVMSPLGRTAVVVKSGGTTATYYLHTDHLGSVEFTSDQLGIMNEQYSYDAWGLARKDTWEDTSDRPVRSAAPRGFTDHEMLDHIGLIHMNGRIYDPTTSRFLRADPLVQAPENPQSYNRYSYCFNNPLSMTDPTGYSGVGENLDLFAPDLFGYQPSGTTFYSGGSFGSVGSFNFQTSLVAPSFGLTTGVFNTSMFSDASFYSTPMTVGDAPNSGAEAGYLRYLRWESDIWERDNAGRSLWNKIFHPDSGDSRSFMDRLLFTGPNPYDGKLYWEGNGKILIENVGTTVMVQTGTPLLAYREGYVSFGFNPMRAAGTSSLNALRSYSGASTLAWEDAESLANGYGFSLRRGSLARGSRFEPKTGEIFISPEHLQLGRVNSLVLAEELQHGIDEVAGLNTQAIERMRFGGLTNEAFHSEVFNRILQTQGEFDFLTESDLTLLGRIKSGLK